MKLPQTPNEKKIYVVHCDYCSYHFTTDKVGLTPVVRCKIPRGIPKTTKEKQKYLPQMPTYKCPKCGRGVTARTMNVKKSIHEEEKNDEPKDIPPGCEASPPGQ